MAKVVKNVTLDYDVVTEFRLTSDEKLSTVLNNLLRNYTDLNGKPDRTKEELESEQKKILEEKSKLNSKLSEVKAKLQNLEKNDKQLFAKKESDFKKLGDVLFNNNREKFDEWWDNKYGN